MIKEEEKVMMGKMYRPLRIKRKERGYQFSHKYMSNLLGREKGGVKEFDQTVKLKSTISGNEIHESIVIEFEGLTIPVLADGDKFEQVTGKQVAEKKAPFFEIDKKQSGLMVRKLERPGISLDVEGETEHGFAEFKKADWVFFDEENEKENNEAYVGDLTKGKWVLRTDMSSRGEDLCFEMPIHPTGQNEGTDWLKVEIKPIVVDGEEYMEIKTESKTQVVITSNTKIMLRS